MRQDPNLDAQIQTARHQQTLHASPLSDKVVSDASVRSTGMSPALVITDFATQSIKAQVGGGQASDKRYERATEEGSTTAHEVAQHRSVGIGRAMLASGLNARNRCKSSAVFGMAYGATTIRGRDEALLKWLSGGLRRIAANAGLAGFNASAPR